MKIKYVTRTFTILCLCFISSLIKSEDKGCSTHCMLTATSPAAKYAAMPAEKNDGEILTYYGFYSKY